jgi:hypothetical protein
MGARSIVAGALAVGAAFGVTLPAASTGATTRAADCDVRVAGHEFPDRGYVRLRSSKRATIAVTALDEKPGYRVQLELAGVRSTVGTGRGKDFGWHRDLNIPSYADFGVGTYRLRIITTVAHQPCVVTGFIDITGRAPITTVAGGVATLVALAAVVGLLAMLFRRGGRPLRTRQVFGVDNPLGEFVAVNTPGDYVAWAEVACDQGARTFVTAKPDASAIRAFLAEAHTKTVLDEIAHRGVRVRGGTGGVALPRFSWQPRPFVVGPIVGLIGALAVLTYLQQAAKVYPNYPTIALTAAIGVGLGLLIANGARLLGAYGLNRRLADAEAGLVNETVEPRYPPIDHLDKLDTFVWTPTHTVPHAGDGLPAWADADRTDDEVATLDPGLQVRVVEQRDGLAQVVCSNGWVGWTDAEPLEAIDT